MSQNIENRTKINIGRKYMYKTAMLVFIIFLLTFCVENKEDSTNKLECETQVGKKILLNCEKGYITNPITGDSILPIINILGDTVITGVPIAVRGIHIPLNSLKKPNVVGLKKTKLIDKSLNENAIIPNPKVIPVIKDSISVLNVIDSKSSIVLKNSKGDTLLTGRPIHLEGKKVKARQPELILALSPRFRDKAKIDIQYLDIEQGLSSSNTLSILEDKSGNIWIGTDKGGVCKYDGIRFINYTMKEGLSNDMILSMIEDRNGNIWFGTYGGGVCCFDGRIFTQYTENEGFSSNIVWSLFEDSKGNIWFGTVKGGISKYDGKNFIHYYVKEGFVNSTTLSIYEDKKGNIWFGTFGSGVVFYDGKSFNHINTNSGLPSNRIWSVTEDNDGNIWMGTEGAGAVKYTGDQFINYTESDGLSGNNIYSVLKDKKNNIWFACFEKGMSKYNGHNFETISKDEGLSTNQVWKAMQIESGKIWIAAYVGGVNIINEEKFESFSLDNVNTDLFVSGIKQDKNGNIWIATSNSGVIKIEGSSVYQFSEEQGLCSNNILSIFEDRDGNMWFGSSAKGVSMFDGKVFTNYDNTSGLIDNNVLSIFEDSKGNVWFGSDRGGLTIYNRKEFIHYSEKEGFSNNVIWSIIEDVAGNIWLGTVGGLIKYDGTKFITYSTKEGLPNNHIYSVLEDHSGNLWLGTAGGGLVKFDGEYFIDYSQKQGLSNNLVYSVLEDKNNRIWVSTENGISLLNENRTILNNAALSNFKPDSSGTYIYKFGKSDGLKMTHFEPKSAMIDKDDNLWWGTYTGLIKADLKSFVLSTKVPDLQLNNIEINGSFIDFNNLAPEFANKIRFKNIEPFYNYPLDLELVYNYNHLNFQFSAIDWTAPHKIRYRFKLDGLDKSWSQPSEKSFAEYRNLPFGEFTFKVCAIGESNVWSKPFEYHFVIHPPWWNTWIAWFSYIFLVIILIISYVRFRTNQLRRKQKLLKMKISEATSEIETQNEELWVTLEKLKETQAQLIQSEKMASLGTLSAGIAHEINNPLNFIQGGVLALELNMDETSLQQHSYFLNAIKTGVQRASDIVISLNHFSNKSNSLDEPVNIELIVDNCLNIIQNEIRNKIDVHKHFSNEKYLLLGNEGRMHQAVLNVLSNAVQAIEVKGTIEIDTTIRDKYIELTIKDNGSGIKPEILSKITDPFFTTKSPGQGTGLGLSITYSIIIEHNGTLHFYSEQGKGTKVVISLPLIINQ